MSWGVNPGSPGPVPERSSASLLTCLSSPAGGMLPPLHLWDRGGSSPTAVRPQGAAGCSCVRDGVLGTPRYSDWPNALGRLETGSFAASSAPKLVGSWLLLPCEAAVQRVSGKAAAPKGARGWDATPRTPRGAGAYQQAAAAPGPAPGWLLGNCLGVPQDPSLWALLFPLREAAAT